MTTKKVKFVTAYLGIGLHKHRDKSRTDSFYVDGIKKWIELLPESSLEVFAPPHLNLDSRPFSYSTVVNLLGEAYDKLEERRIVQGANLKHAAAPWYSALTHAKIALMSLVSKENDDASVVWVDAGLPSHNWFDYSKLRKPQEVNGFHAFNASWLHNWSGAGMHEVMRFPSAKNAVAGGILATDSSSLQMVVELYQSVMEESFGKYAHPVEEDVLTIIHNRFPNTLQVHESYHALIANVLQ